VHSSPSGSNERAYRSQVSESLIGGKTHADGDYLQWRRWKLDSYRHGTEDCLIPVRRSGVFSKSDLTALHDVLRTNNFVFYDWSETVPEPGDQETTLYQLCRSLRLTVQVPDFENHDEILNHSSSDLQARLITDLENGRSTNKYIPYTSRSLNWHTDGYYHRSADAVRSFVMHCLHPAQSGGENSFLCPEIAYIWLRDENPEWISLLSRCCFEIPANESGQVTQRATFHGAIFEGDYQDALLMRYTQRQRHIKWDDDQALDDARTFLADKLNNDRRYVVRIKLDSGQGVICNNVLHRRDAYQDGETPRTLLRLRFNMRASNKTDPVR